jgi:hypothetical protein
MLWMHFKRDLSLEAAEHERLYWGRALQDDILEATARKYRADIAANVAGDYVRDGQLGATLDGESPFDRHQRRAFWEAAREGDFKFESALAQPLRTRPRS